MTMDYNEQQLLQQLTDPTTTRKAFAQLVDHYSEPLYWKIRQFVYNHDDANDVLQNTFLKVWSNLNTFRGEAKLTTWLHRIAINEALDFIRRRKESLSLDQSEASGLAARLMADEQFSGSKAEALLMEAAEQLPDVQKTVFNLRYFNDMKYQDISEILHTTEGALKASYHIAVKKITAYLKEHDENF